MKTNHYPNKIACHLVPIVPITPFTLKSTSKLRSFLHCILVRLNFNNHFDTGFHNTFDYNHSICRDYLLCTVTASAHIMP